MTEVTREGTEIILQERIKLLKVVVDQRRYKGSEIQWRVSRISVNIKVLRFDC